MSDWHQYPDRDELDRSLAAYLAGLLREDIARRGAASLAVSGGSTPAQMFSLLSQSALDWSKVWLTLVDERWVDTGSADSNEHLLRDKLLCNAAAAANFVGLMGDTEEAGEGLAEVEKRLADVPRPFTAVVLGMGGDGHTASWFPQATNLQALLDPAGDPALAATEPVTAPYQRITLTMPAVLDSRQVLVHITGEEKRSVLENARASGVPIAAILEQTTTPASIWWAP